jgi:tRNA-specific 2-thiouridylase
VRALVLISGGLDSILAARLLLEQGLEVTGVSFESPFFNADRARRSAEELGIELVVLDIGEDVLRIIEEPKYGFGRNMNPCIDCHSLMVRRAAQLMEKLGASFVATGEVVGQRPKSQMRFGLEAVEREAGIGGLLLRPLSARLLDPTTAELKGWVDRSRLLGLHGRTRKPQMELAEKFGIESYESPAGGCLLTDVNFSRAVKDLLDHDGLTVPGVRLLSVGRQFRISERAKLAVGRNHSENERLFDMAVPGALYIKVVDHKGPVGVLTGAPTEEDESVAAAVVARYADTGDCDSVAVDVQGDGVQRRLEVEPMPPREVRGLSV